MKRRYIYENTKFTVEDILAIIRNINPKAADVIGKKYSEVLQFYVDHNWESAQGAAENIYTVYSYGFEPELCLQMAKDVNRMFEDGSINESAAKKKSKKRYSEEDMDDIQDFIDDCTEIIE